MNKDVLISMNGLQAIEGTNDTVEVITVGEYYNKNGKHYIIYEDVDEDNGQKTKNIIKVSHQSIEVRKTGYINTNMIFEKDRINKSYYATPFGDLSVEIDTSDIEIEEEEQSIKIRIDYALIINAQPMNQCNIDISVKSLEK